MEWRNAQHVSTLTTMILLTNIIVVSMLTCCALLHSIFDLKAAQKNVQHSLIWEHMLYKFKLGHNAMEATKNIFCAKGESAVDCSTVTRSLKKFSGSCNNLDNQVRLNRPKTMDSKAVFQVREGNLASSFWRVSGELVIPQSSVVCHLYKLSKSIQNCCIVSHIIKICEPNFLTIWNYKLKLNKLECHKFIIF